MAINPLQQPIDYTAQMPDISRQFAGFNVALGELGERRRQEQAAQQAAEAQQKFSQDFQAALSSGRQEDFVRLALEYPSMAEPLKEAREVIGKQQLENEMREAFDISSLFENGQPEAAGQKLKDVITARQEAGLPTGPYERALEMYESGNPLGAQAAINFSMMLAAPETMTKFYQAKEAARGPEQFEILTAEQAANMGLEPGVTYQRNLKTNQIKPVGTGAGVTVQVGGATESEFQKQAGKDVAAQFKLLSEAGANAARSSILVNQLEDAFRSADVQTGAAGVLSTALTKFGIEVPGGSDYEKIDALVSRLVPAQRVAGSGSMSDADLDLFKRSLPSLMGTKEGQLKIIADMKAVANYDRKLGEIANLARLGEISMAEAQRRIDAVANPLEEYRGTGGGAGGAGAAATPTSSVMDQADAILRGGSNGNR